MILAGLPPNEAERLMELFKYEILNTQYEEDYDEIAKLASSICQTPISTITLIDANQQWFKAKVGVDNSSGDRSTSFCAHAILQDEIMEVPDALLDDRFHDNPMVTDDPGIRFYAGYPLINENGFKLGTLCVIDKQPRTLSIDQKRTLVVLGKQVIKLFELRLKQRQTEAQKQIIEDQKASLQEYATIQNKIISIIAHDVRGPIASVKTMIELAKNGELSEEEQEHLLDLLDKQLDGTLDMLTNVVDWGSMLTKKGKFVMAPVDISQLVKEKMMKNMHPFLEQKGNQLINEVPEGVLIDTDENTIRFILRNLISNSNKFTSNGTIRLSANKEDDRLIVTVTDTGCGMNAEMVQSLFNPLKRQSREGTHREKGSGLGLVLVKDFADALNISLDIHSEEGKGTRISLVIPN
jgi:signal transduction histidine kinase